ncbi:MAG: agmatine deiminase family protein [Phycisphaerales bacterium]|nr:agmatine deiminase family protein [Phycisphaerales bacterium]MCB9857293.1 agmatine deiminase family protein [Phycisphaerales bacterium]MCB9862993.1 agmatine deiminase family protein [Phycisphaerales bacterium]
MKTQFTSGLNPSAVSRVDNRPRRRASWLWLFIVVAFVPCVTRAEGPASDPPEAPEAGQILSDTSGRIAEVLLHFDDEIEAELAPVYRDLFAGLGDDVRIRVLCETGDSARRFAERWQDVATRGNRNMDVVNVGMPLSIWARDRCISRSRGDAVQRSASFVPSANPYYEYEKHNDLRTQRMLYRGLLGPSVLRSWLQLEGGNVIANGKQVFIGANVAEENDCELPDPQLRRELAKICGRNYHLVGERIDYLPWDHVDMYMTPIGEDTILVASATAGNSFVTQACDPDGTEFELSKDVQAALDHVADEMRTLGYRVLRLPAVFGATGDWIMTYNNVVMDERNGHRVVLMPIYNVPDMDQAAAQAYAKLGFEVKTIDVSGVYEYGGAVRCIVNVVDRKRDVPTRVDPRQLAEVRHGKVRVLDVSSFIPRRITRVYGEEEITPETEPVAGPTAEPMNVLRR